MILYVIIVYIGLLLLIIPGIYLAARYQFFYYHLLRNPKDSIINALRASSHITKGHRWKLVGFGFVLAGVNFLGLLAVGVGLLITIPLTGMASAKVYRLLVEEKNNTTLES